MSHELALQYRRQQHGGHTINLTRAALGNPVAVASAVLLVLLFGLISLLRMPIQMIPDIERPQIQINTSWRGAAPEEVESEIVEPQEEVLRDVPGLLEMISSANRGRASISLEFAVEVDLQRALIEVLNRLNQVPRYPVDANEPAIFAGRGQFGSSIAWFAIRPAEGNDTDISVYQDFIEEYVKSRIERVPGIANSDIYGGRGQEIRVSFDPYRAAAHQIDLSRLAVVAGNNKDVSGGFRDVGRRQYTVRFAGQYTISEFADMVIAWRDGEAVRLRDVAVVDLAPEDRTGTLSQNGGPAVAINAQPEKGVNILDVMRDLKIAAEELNETTLKRAGLHMEQVYDETLYVKQSIAMLRTNLMLGISLAVGILWWFLRKLRATVIVALAIPVSLFTTFVALEASGRTINIISLAGLAFAVGMVLDAAIVVLENIVRLRERGDSSDEAAQAGASQVSSALVASTATTVAIFLPIVFLRDTAGQLFADLALAMSTAVIASLIVALTIVPAAANTFLRRARLKDPHADWWNRGSDFVMRLTDTRKRRAAWIAGLAGISALLSVLLLPSTDYLPEGKQNFIFGFVLPPPGQSVQSSRTEFVDIVDRRLRAHLDGSAEPAIDNYFLGLFGSRGFIGVRVLDADDVEEFVGILNRQILAGFPDTMAFASRSAIFGRLGGSREIDLNIQSRDIDAMLTAARVGAGKIGEALPGANVRPEPGLELAEPELRLVPNERRVAEAGWTRQTVANIIRAFGTGLYIGDYFDGDMRRDIILRGPLWQSPEELVSLPVYTPGLGVQRMGDLVRIERTSGPDQIRRVDRRRTVTLVVRPPSDMPLSDAIDTLRRDVEPGIRAMLPEDGEISYRGTADDKDIALGNLRDSFALAVAILYLLMSGLFRSFLDSLLVMIALPLATVGGLAMLYITNRFFVFQPLDLLTIIGFIILLGLVVNNAILLVHQTRAGEREGRSRREAVKSAVHMRLRPILMSTLTSIFGMLPLLLIPGAGTEVYRGLAAVIVGGMSVSTLFTLILLPSLLRIGEDRITASVAASARPGYATRES